MLSGNRLLVLGAHASVLCFSEAVSSEIFLIERKEKFKVDQLRWARQCLIADFTNPDPLLPIIAGAHAAAPFAQVYSPTEAGLIPAAVMNEFLGLRGTPASVATALKNKAIMRRLLKDAGVSRVKFAIADSKQALRRFSREVEGPIITKPLDSSGSFGVFRLGYPLSEVELDEVWQCLVSCQLEEFLVEEFLSGREISVEAFSFNGRHTIFALTDKLIASNFVEIGHVIPADLAPETAREVTDLVRRFLDLMGIKDGPSHTEVMLTANGPLIIESHNRTGGDNIPQLVEMACGIQLFHLAYGWPSGRVEPVEESPRITAAGAILYFWPSPGIVADVRGLDQANALSGVKEVHVGVKIGDRVASIKRSADRVGFVTAQAKTSAEALGICQQAIRLVEIETIPDEQ